MTSRLDAVWFHTTVSASDQEGFWSVALAEVVRDID